MDSSTDNEYEEARDMVAFEDKKGEDTKKAMASTVQVTTARCVMLGNLGKMPQSATAHVADQHASPSLRQS